MLTLVDEYSFNNYFERMSVAWQFALLSHGMLKAICSADVTVFDFFLTVPLKTIISECTGPIVTRFSG